MPVAPEDAGVVLPPTRAGGAGRAPSPRYRSPDDLTQAQLERFRRHLSLTGFGPEPQLRLLNAHAVVIGAGGLGAPVLSYLAAAGVGRITVIDADVVERSNLHRQVIHGESVLGRPKTASAARTVRELHPEAEVTEIREVLDAGNALRLLAGADVVLDGSDNFPTRYAVADAAEILRVPVVYGAILRFDGQVSVFWPGRGPLYRDLFPTMPGPGEVPSCAEAGVIGVLPGVIGTLMATEAVKVLAGVGEPLIGRLLFYDALTAGFREVPFAPDPRRRPVTRMGAVRDYDAAACAVPPGEDAGGSAASARPARESGQIPPERLRRWRAEEEAPLVLDVREAWEHRLGAIPGSPLLPLGEIQRDPAAAAHRVRRLREQAGAGGGPVVLYCQAGVRSRRAQAALAAADPDTPWLSLSGGYDAWEREDA